MDKILILPPIINPEQFFYHPWAFFENDRMIHFKYLLLKVAYFISVEYDF